MTKYKLQVTGTKGQWVCSKTSAILSDIVTAASECGRKHRIIDSDGYRYLVAGDPIVENTEVNMNFGVGPWGRTILPIGRIITAWDVGCCRVKMENRE